MSGITPTADRGSKSRIWLALSTFLGIAIVAIFSNGGTGERGGPSVAYAGPAPMELSLENVIFVDVKDLAGATVYFGGQVFENGTLMGNFAAQQRITPPATGFLNTAQVTITIFFTGQTPPDNITLEGASDFNTSAAMGSVSATSPHFKTYVGQTFQLTPINTNTFNLMIK
jgi:hypothetical protein